MQNRKFAKTGQPCPCGKGSDSTGINEDGSAYCFTCTKYFPKYGENVAVDTPQSYTPPPSSDYLFEFGAIPERKLSEQTCKKFGVKILKDSNGITKHQYPYSNEDGKVVGAKTRVVQGKDFYYKGEKVKTLFGQNVFKKKSAKFITLVEGELDALAAFQMLSTPKFMNPPVVSIKDGAGSASRAVKDNLVYLESFDNVILCMDQDEHGKKATAEISKLLKPGKVKIMSLPKGFKDPCDMLIGNRSVDFTRSWWDAETYIPSGILNVSKLKKEFFTEEHIDHIDYPWEGLNTKLFGMRKKELVTLTGGTGLGKSSVTRELEHWIMKKTDENVGILALEEDWKRTTMGIVSIEANQRLFIDQIRREYPQDKIEAVYDKLFEGENSDRCYIHAHLGIQNIDDIFAKLRYLVVGCDCQWVVVDHLHMLVASSMEGDERRTIDDIMLRLRSLVEETGCGMILVSHLRRTQEDKGHEQGVQVSLSHLRGSQSIAQMSDTVIALERNQQAANPEEANKTILRVLKSRHTGDTGIACALQYDRETGRLHEVEVTPDEFQVESTYA